MPVAKESLIRDPLPKDVKTNSPGDNESWSTTCILDSRSWYELCFTFAEKDDTNPNKKDEKYQPLFGSKRWSSWNLTKMMTK